MSRVASDPVRAVFRLFLAAAGAISFGEAAASDGVVDDLSGAWRFFDFGYVCSVSHVVADASISFSYQYGPGESGRHPSIIESVDPDGTHRLDSGPEVPASALHASMSGPDYEYGVLVFEVALDRPVPTARDSAWIRVGNRVWPLSRRAATLQVGLEIRSDTFSDVTGGCRPRRFSKP